jgi:hypothetical protein
MCQNVDSDCFFWSNKTKEDFSPYFSPLFNMFRLYKKLETRKPLVHHISMGYRTAVSLLWWRLFRENSTKHKADSEGTTRAQDRAWWGLEVTAASAPSYHLNQHYLSALEILWHQ